MTKCICVLVKVTVFWDAIGLIHIDYLQKEKKNNQLWIVSQSIGIYPQRFEEMNDCIRSKKSVPLHLVYARVHQCVGAMTKFNELCNDLLIRHIVRIYLQVTKSSFQIWWNGLAERDSAPRMKTLLMFFWEQMQILFLDWVNKLNRGVCSSKGSALKNKFFFMQKTCISVKNSRNYRADLVSTKTSK